MENIRIALVQMQVGETESNIKKIEKFVEEAQKQAVSIICFPEAAVQGYQQKKAGESAERIPGEISGKIAKLARDNDLTILTGIIEKSAIYYAVNMYQRRGCISIS